ncbi:MAG: hypothetical protein ACO3NW_07425 [Kiritimatiellia bacterium]
MKAEEEMRAWRNWREACALEKISAPESARLREVIAERFRSMLRKLHLHGGAQLPAPSAAECAQLFESYCALHQRQDGKKYKHWLLTRGRQDLDTVQSGVMLLIRNVVREWVRDCHPATAAVSLQQRVGLGSTPVTLEELLPAEAAEPRSADQCAWMEQMLRRAEKSLEPAERAVLILRARGTVFSAPGVRAEFGLGKTALHKYHRTLLENWAEEIKKFFPGLPPQEGAAMVLDLMDEMGKKLFLHSSAEKEVSAAFGRVEAPDDENP